MAKKEKKGKRGAEISSSKKQQATRQKGATRTAARQPPQESKPSRLRSLIRAVVQTIKLVGIALMCLAALYFSREYWNYWSSKPVSDVLVKGEFDFISRDQLADNISLAIADGFMGLELEAIREELLHNPWVDQVSVRRRWPSTLVVTVIEHRPIARWGAEAVLNHRGEVILLEEKYRQAHQLQSLPELEGPDGLAQEVMQHYQTLSQMFANSGLAVTALRSDAGRNWTMKLNEIVVIVGRDRLMEKVGNFLLVYEKRLRDQWRKVKSVDLRYETGVAVAWKNLDAEKSGSAGK